MITTDVIFLSLPKNLQQYRHAAIIAAIILLSALFPQMIFALNKEQTYGKKNLHNADTFQTLKSRMLLLPQSRRF